MKSAKRISRRPNILPLEREERFEKDPDTGETVRVTRERRGLLVTESRHYGPSNLNSLISRISKQREPLQELCDHLRDQLEKRGLPSDRTPHWISFNDEEWKPRSDSDYDPTKPIVGSVSEALWIARVESMTKPLTIESTNGELLFALIQMLGRDGISPHLGYIGQVMEAYSRYRMSGNINYLATEGLKARKARAAGPMARQNRANEVRRVIYGLAERYWTTHPIYRGDASNTAGQIAQVANDELRSKRLLPANKNSLSVKTIGDYIRTGTRG